jgi:hypothetical protein
MESESFVSLHQSPPLIPILSQVSPVHVLLIREDLIYP